VKLTMSSQAPAYVRDQDRLLPIANISRIMKRALPENAKVSKEAKEAIQECVSEFIGFVTSEASERLRLEKRKTINGPDLIFAMRALGFDDYIPYLELFLEKYRKASRGDGSDVKRGRKKAKISRDEAHESPSSL